MGSPGMRLAREQVRRGTLAIAEPRHPTAAVGTEGLMGVRVGFGTIDLVALGTGGIWAEDNRDIDLLRMGSRGMAQ